MNPYPANTTLPPRIGRKARIVRVAVAYADGRPVVFVNHPVVRCGDRDVPFPTLYWLVCPDLVRAVSQLEHDGVIAELQRQLDADDALRRRLGDDHRRYIAQRRRLIDVDRYRAVADHLAHRGIAGMRNFAAVKCLHAHYAQHLADSNCIGTLLEKCGLVVRPSGIIHTP